MQERKASCDLFWDSAFGDALEVPFGELVQKLVEYVEYHRDKPGSLSDDDICIFFRSFQALMQQLAPKSNLDVRINIIENDSDAALGAREQGELCQVFGLLWACAG